MCAEELFGGPSVGIFQPIGRAAPAGLAHSGNIYGGMQMRGIHKYWATFIMGCGIALAVGAADTKDAQDASEEFVKGLDGQSL